MMVNSGSIYVCTFSRSIFGVIWTPMQLSIVHLCMWHTSYGEDAVLYAGSILSWSEWSWYWNHWPCVVPSRLVYTYSYRRFSTSATTTIMISTYFLTYIFYVYNAVACRTSHDYYSMYILYSWVATMASPPKIGPLQAMALNGWEEKKSPLRSGTLHLFNRVISFLLLSLIIITIIVFYYYNIQLFCNWL